jgi:uncharacterized membrane protein
MAHEVPSVNTAPAVSPQRPPPIPRVAPMSREEIEAGKAFAILSYALNFASVPFWIVPLVMRDNEFSLYHAKQCFTAFLTTLAVAFAAMLLMPVFCLGVPVMIGMVVVGLMWNICGIINASQGVVKPVPMLPHGGPRWMDGIRKVPKPGGA